MMTIVQILISIAFLLFTIKKWEWLEEQYMEIAAVFMNAILWVMILFTL